MSRVHVIGAGLAGLGAATTLAEAGFGVRLADAAPQAGGRCRSYYDPQLELTIDNGNHLVLSGNQGVADYLDRIGASDRLIGPDTAVFSFIDLADDSHWTIRPNAGPIPWWAAVAGRRVPGTVLRDYLPLARLLKAGPDACVGDVLPTTGALWRRLLEPFLVAALNTPAAGASARLAGAVVRETLARGGHAYRPRIAAPTLAAAFVDPALAWLERQGAAVTLNRRLRAIVRTDTHVTGLDYGDGIVPVAPHEMVVLAVPAWSAAALLPELTVPDAHHAILNAHFRIAPPAGAAPMIGLVGGTSEWIFAFADRLSVTVSAADRFNDEPRAPLAARLWTEVARVHRIDAPLPPWQIVREKRATFSATPEQDRRRPAAVTRWSNLLLAGDWTQTGLPATIEGALRSGTTAASHVIRTSTHHVAD